jgi:hypothetical protein
MTVINTTRDSSSADPEARRAQTDQERRAKWKRIQAADPTLAALLRAARAKFDARVVELYIGEERVL